MGLERGEHAVAQQHERVAIGNRLAGECAAEPPIAEQLARAIRALDHAIREAHE